MYLLILRNSIKNMTLGDVVCGDFVTKNKGRFTNSPHTSDIGYSFSDSAVPFLCINSQLMHELLLVAISFVVKISM